MIDAILVLLIAGLGWALWLLYEKTGEARSLREKYSKVIDIDSEVELRKSEAAQFLTEIENLRASYGSKKEVFDRLSRELAVVEESLEMVSFGVYAPHFDLSDSEAYKKAILDVTEEQKEAIKNGTAIVCRTEWQVGGSKREGKKMVDRAMRLMLRAFNSECDAAISKVKWSNALVMEERIRKAFEAINKLGETQTISIQTKYLELMLKELRLTHEKEEKAQKEKEEQRAIKEQMREEEKVRLEIERKMAEQEKEEAREKRALENALAEVEKAEGEKRAQLQGTIEELQKKIAEIAKEKERVKSRAEMTRSGHIYVISNVGSFGEGVFKIGMTRRLEPMDRVKELGDASVPFSFDVHAMVYTEDAPKMEGALHRAFDRNRVNLVNDRKEFFTFDLTELEQKVKDLGGEIKLTMMAEAREFRETQAMRAAKTAQNGPSANSTDLPDAL
jgi:hypothetical protein